MCARSLGAESKVQGRAADDVHDARVFMLLLVPEHSILAPRLFSRRLLESTKGPQTCMVASSYRNLEDLYLLIVDSSTKVSASCCGLG